jgi:2-polyprenyl-6-hydroxyphenyl methylase/3-demethylubiquinone-9 3-methyltransferase
MKKAQSRFSFGANWQSFVNQALTPERIHEAVDSLRTFFGVNDFEGQTFLDIGCGSGLFSLSARKLGAKVHSFDLDPLSVACATELKRRYFPEDSKWTIDQGSVLDGDYLNSLGQFNLVYSWGVLHHTGAMWQALGNVIPLVAEEGKLYISIYNDQGDASRRWAALKKFYNQSPKPVRISIVLMVGVLWFIRSAFGRLIQCKNPLPFKEWAEEKKNRGMSVWHDLVDWVGGHPFEVAKPEEIFDFYRDEGFVLMRLKTRGGKSGCNEFLFFRSLGKGKTRTPIEENRSKSIGQ